MRNVLVIILIMGAMLSCSHDPGRSPASVDEAMDAIVTRFYQNLAPEELDTIGTQWILTHLSQEEKQVLATKFLYFDVNIPVRVSLMRDRDQKMLPFWLESAGFKKTTLEVRNSHSVYEVWQKDFEAGKVELGINGFDKHRPVYFISVGPRDPGADLEISHVFPEGQHFELMQKGAFTYHDWDELTLEQVPGELKGQVLFTTIRGRAREAHLAGAFRTTAHPSGTEPDQVLLSWSADPSTSMDIQWRCNSSVSAGLVKYWESASSDTLMAVAEVSVMEDRLLRNDRFVHRFRAQLEDLSAGTAYSYLVGSEAGGWSDTATFRTGGAPEKGFSFIWFGDTHKSEHWGELLQHSFQKHPGTAFYSIAGDLVSTGLNRNEWDEFLHLSEPVFRHRPLMPVPGNHDSQDGLGAGMYRDIFSLPENGPEGVRPELSYAFHYQNALFLMLDATSPLELQSKWIEEQLSTTDAQWKFAMFHFPPYNYEEDYSGIRREWCSLFDSYHVDMVMSGHTHYYMRSKPMCNEQVVDDPSEGTVYVISVGIPGRHGHMPDEAYAEVRDGNGWLYQYMEIRGDSLIYKALDMDGNVRDTFIIENRKHL